MNKRNKKKKEITLETIGLAAPARKRCSYLRKYGIISSVNWS
jgi:hypothetical protein